MLGEIVEDVDDRVAVVDERGERLVEAGWEAVERPRDRLLQRADALLRQ